MRIDQDISISNFKEGLALFNSFSGDTHFLAFPYELVLSLLKIAPQKKQHLLTVFCEQFNQQSNELEEQFEQFISEAINSGIIVEKDT